MLTIEQLTEFEDRGLVRVAGLLPLARVAILRDALITHLERKGLWHNGGWSPSLPRFEEAPAAGFKLAREVKHHPALKELIAPEVMDAIGQLTGGKPVRAMMDAAQVLFTLPNARDWSVPSTVWHLDLPRLPGDGLPGVQLFTFLDQVEPHGGGTLVVAGSHRLLGGQFIRSRDLKKRLKREPWFADLFSGHVHDRARFVDRPGRAGNVPVQVVELTGQPGDVYLVDIRLLHTLAPNAGSVPRMMATQRFLLDETWQTLSDLEQTRQSA
jgi:hypothetical protein